MMDTDEMYECILATLKNAPVALTVEEIACAAGLDVAQVAQAVGELDQVFASDDLYTVFE